MKFADFFQRNSPPEAIFHAALKIAFDADGITEHIERLGEECRVVYLMSCFRGEVINGGLDQLFTNSAGNHCLQMLDALTALGAYEHYRILQHALRWFPNGLPSANRKERYRQMVQFHDSKTYEEDISKLNSELDTIDQKLSALIENYVLQNPNAKLTAI